MAQIILIGLVAGAATALLFASVASGSLIAVLLFYLAPLPILIAALGWSHWAALVAAVSASAGLASVFGPFFFLAFLIGIGLPAWWLGYLALLARPAAQPNEEGVEWYPAGHLVVWAALLGAAVVVAGVVNFGLDEETFRASMRVGIERVIRAQSGGADSGAPADSGRLVDFLISLLPPAAAVVATVTSVVNLWLAARITRVSGRLRRPPPEISAMKFPGYTPGLLAAAIAGSFLPGLPGIIAGVLTASLLMAYALLGFAVMHAITRNLSSRSFVLAGTYASVFVFGWPMLLMTLLGLVDSVMDLRGRRANKSPPPTRP